MSFGDLIQQEYLIPEIARVNRIGPRQAAAETLAVYLRNAKFYVYGGDDNDTKFTLAKVLTQWPDPKIEMEYPSASIVEAGPSEHDPHNFSPTLLENTLGVYDCLIGYPPNNDQTVLCKESELNVQFQVDFWLSLQADREAVEAAISAIFNPSEATGGVILEGPEQYYSREFRFTLLATDYDDTEDNAYESEWRLRCVVQCEGDIVSLRKAVIVPTPSICIDVIDPNDPEES